MNSHQSDSTSVAPGNEVDRRALLILLLAAIIGIGFGSLTAADWFGNYTLPDTVVARVNDTDIQLGEYHRALRMLSSERRDPLTEQDRTLVLERMIEEELLLQHGLASGLVHSDRDVRTAVTQSILTGLLVDVEADATTTTELREYLGQLREVATLRWMVGGPG